MKSNVKAKSFSGWRASALGLLSMAAVLTIIICSLLLASLFKYGNGWSSLQTTSSFYSGSCKKSSQLSQAIHFAINAISSLILASSNYFLQILLAPTRKDLDKVHAQGRFAEIGVQSLHNFRVIPSRKICFWFVLALSSVPLHLVFNTCILEARGSTDFVMVIAAEGFLDGSPYLLSGAGNLDPDRDEDRNVTLSHIQSSLLSSEWDRLSLSECLQRYNNSRNVLRDYRNVVLVVNSNGNDNSSGWDDWEVFHNATDDDDRIQISNDMNSLWTTIYGARTDLTYLDLSSKFESLDKILSQNDPPLILSSGVISVQSDRVQEAYRTLDAEYCVSERITTPCRLEVENSLLGVVCLMCLLKCAICVAVVILLRRESPLATPGDAIESFLLEPDTQTKGMCAFERSDFASRRDAWRATRKIWNANRKRAGSAVPRWIWTWTYFIICLGLGINIAFLVLALNGASVSSTSFGQDSRNPNVNWIGSIKTHGSEELVVAAILANSPQLLLSVSYLAYNGILTRIFAEFEWSSYSQQYTPLRVTCPRGEQRSTYRLQLPLHWSLPLLAVSILLHWLYSNCLYVADYESYNADYPYDIEDTFKWMQYSTKSILIALLIALFLLPFPILFAIRKLPGPMVLGGACSAVISAACHNATETTQPLMRENTEYEEVPLDNENEDERLNIATGKVKWGVLSRDTLGSMQPKVEKRKVPGCQHLGFGSISQDVGAPRLGEPYMGHE